MRPVVVALLACASLAWTDASNGQTAPVGADAHAAYARGTTAFRRGDYASAAREYAAADALAPNPVALQAALDATVLADDPVFGTTLLDRARGEPRTDALLTTMLTAEKKFAHRVGRIRLQCPAAPCLGAIDGAAAVTGEPIVVRVGSHAVTLEAAGTLVQRVVTVAPDDTIVVAPDAAPAPVPPPAPASPPFPPPAPSPTRAPVPAPAPLPPAAHHAGLSPLFFYAGLGLTAVVGGFAIASGVDTADRHSAFEQHCTPSCATLASQGQSAQTRTNVLLGVTAGLGVATLVTALLVRWHDASLSVGASRVAFDARF
jgi:hypothetical protein